MDTRDFVNTFEPYRNQHARQISEIGLFGAQSSWVVVRGYLTDSLIKQALSGAATLAYYKRTWVNSFGVDIDGHEQGSPPTLNPEVKRKATLTIDRIGKAPSICIESPHGIHLYYFFRTHTSWLVMYTAVNRKLEGVDVEILPTPNKPLRIPREHWFLDPATWEPIDPPAPDAVVRYEPTILYTKDETACKKKTGWSRLANMEAKEREYYPLENGCTNRTVVECGIAYRLAGLPIKDAVQHFYDNLVEPSKGYCGDLRAVRNIERRFRAIYSQETNYIPQPRTAQMSLLDEEIISHLVDIAPFARQRQEPLRKFFTEMLLWEQYIRGMKEKDPAMFTYMCEKYPYFRKNVLAGYIPMPKSLLRQWNDRHFEIMEFGRQIGFLKPLETETSNSGTYSTQLHVCKHYLIDKEMF